MIDSARSTRHPGLGVLFLALGVGVLLIGYSTGWTSYAVLKFAFWGAAIFLWLAAIGNFAGTGPKQPFQY